jgi:spore maturation protein CgeB
MIVERLLDDDDERHRRSSGARERLIRAHTFDHRVTELLALIDEHAAESSWRRRVLAG